MSGKTKKPCRRTLSTYQRKLDWIISDLRTSEDDTVTPESVKDIADIKKTPKVQRRVVAKPRSPKRPRRVPSNDSIKRSSGLDPDQLQKLESKAFAALQVIQNTVVTIDQLQGDDDREDETGENEPRGEVTGAHDVGTAEKKVGFRLHHDHAGRRRSQSLRVGSQVDSSHRHHVDDESINPLEDPRIIRRLQQRALMAKFGQKWIENRKGNGVVNITNFRHTELGQHPFSSRTTEQRDSFRGHVGNEKNGARSQPAEGALNRITGEDIKQHFLGRVRSRVSVSDKDNVNDRDGIKLGGIPSAFVSLKKSETFSTTAQSRVVSDDKTDEGDGVGHSLRSAKNEKSNTASISGLTSLDGDSAVEPPPPRSRVDSCTQTEIHLAAMKLFSHKLELSQATSENVKESKEETGAVIKEENDQGTNTTNGTPDPSKNENGIGDMTSEELTAEYERLKEANESLGTTTQGHDRL